MGELLALRWSDYDEDTAMLEISKSLEETKAAIRVKETKSYEPRFVSLPASAIEALREQRVRPGSRLRDILYIEFIG